MDRSEDAEFRAFLRKLGAKADKLIYEKFETKEDFMRDTGFYKKSLHDILQGARDTHISNIWRLAKSLNVPIETLFKGLD